LSNIQAVISGLVQGLTEFLPVSSSGHLVLIHHLFGINEPLVFFDCLMHVATLFAILIFFRQEVIAVFTRRKHWLFYIAIASIPTVLVGLLYADKIESLFSSVKAASTALLVTGSWLILVELLSKPSEKSLKSANALLIGLAQALAIIPGISRSGATIGAGLLSGLKKEEVVSFSFLLSVPAILGATLLSALKTPPAVAEISFTASLLGMLSAFLIGLVSLRALVFLIKGRKLYLFGIYCLVVGCLGLVNA